MAHTICAISSVGVTLQPHWHLIKQGKRGTETAPLRKHAACLEAGASFNSPWRSDEAFGVSVRVDYPIQDKHCVRFVYPRDP